MLNWASFCRQFGENFRITTNVYVDQTFMCNRHKLHLDSNGNTKDIKIVKIAVENANLWGKFCEMHILLNYAKNVATCEIYGNHIFT